MTGGDKARTVLGHMLEQERRIATLEALPAAPTCGCADRHEEARADRAKLWRLVYILSGAWAAIVALSRLGLL